MDNVGIKHFEPKMEYRMNRFINYELMYDFKVNKLSILFGFGLQGGLTTRDETHVGFTGKITSNITGEEDEFWINFNIRAKYLYWGALSKLSFEYPITSNLKLGLVGGVNYIFAKQFSEDSKDAYFGLTTRIAIVK